MAKVLGESGRYVSNEAERKQVSRLRVVFAVICFLSFAEGVVLPMAFKASGTPRVLFYASSLAFVISALAIARWAERRLTVLERERNDMLRGAAGEHLVAHALATLPEEFKVINDLATRFGNIDHVVVGTTGVFLLDSKNWRGVVAANGHGELTCNGKPLDRPYVKQFTGRIMGIKEKVRTLAAGLDPFFQGVFVFPSARVEARWGSTGNVHCIRDDQVRDYIVGKDFGTKLTKQEVDTISQAFLALAHMEMDFTERASPRAALGQAGPAPKVERARPRAVA